MSTSSQEKEVFNSAKISLFLHSIVQMQSMHRIQTICLFNSAHNLKFYAGKNLIDIDNMLPTV